MPRAHRARRAIPASAWAALALAAAALAAAPRARAGEPARAGDSEPETAAVEVTLESLFDRALTPKLTELTWSPDGTTLAGFWKEGERRTVRAFDGRTGADLWQLDPALLAGPEDAASPAAEAPQHGDAATPAQEEPFPSLKAFSFSPKNTDLLLTADDDLWLWTPGAATARRLTHSPDVAEDDATFAPDGKQVAFVRDHDLWVLELATGRETALTTDGEENEILNGETDWVYWEEIWNRDAEGFWWSPDSRTLAFYRFVEAGVGRYPLLDELGADSTVEWQRYPKPGTPNPTVTIGLVDVASRAIRYLITQTAAEHYLARVTWQPDGQAVVVERLDRDQNRLELLVCNAESRLCRTATEQNATTWVNLTRDFRFLSDGSFLWSDEESGWRDLARYDLLGRKRLDLLPADWVLDEVAEVVEDAGVVVVSAFRARPLGAAERQVLALNLSARVPPRVLADRAGWNRATVASRTGLWVHSWSAAAQPAVQTLRDAQGVELAVLPGGVELPAAIDGLPRPRLLDIAGPGGSRLPAMLIEPAAVAPGHRHPVVVYHYGGPGSQVVSDAWAGARGLWHRWLASRGYGVLAVDNEASTYFGKAGEDRLHRRFGEIELAGQLAGVEFLKTLPWADTGRLGLWGWSGGGANTLYSVVHRPGVWRAAVAGAPVTDWRLYDSIWTERYLDTPESNPEGYRDSSAVTAAGALADALLLVHGTGDDNVHPQNSLVFAAKLIAAGRPFEDAFYPNEKHGFERPANRHFYARMTEFFDRHLGGGAEAPPATP